MAEREDQARRKASREIGRAYRTVKTIRTLYFLLAVGAGLLAVGAILGGYAGSMRALAASAFVLVIGAGEVKKKPGPWSLGMAVAISAIVAAMIMGAPHATISSIWGAAIALALWCVIPLAYRVQKLLKQHPDLYITEKWEGRRKAAAGTERAARIHAETLRQKRESRKKKLIFGGAFVVFVVVVTVLPKMFESRPEEPEEVPVPEFGTRAQDFRDAWNENDWAAIERFLPPRDRARRTPKIKRLMAKRGWDKQRPRLREPRIEPTYSYTKATYAIEGFESDIVFVVYWDAGETEWWWVKTRWPKTELVKR